MLLDICFKALYNIIRRSNFEKSEHKGLIEKSQRLDSIVIAMKERGEADDYIAEVINYFIFYNTALQSINYILFFADCGNIHTSRMWDSQ